MRLLHYSDQPLPQLEDRIEVEPIFNKPHGLWVSVEGEDDWPSWCIENDWFLEALTHVHEVTLTRDHDVLMLTNLDVMRAFSKFYAMPEKIGFHTSTRRLDWEKIQQRWDGLIIAPYQWDLRLDPETEWYYGWDCASGCIWRPSRAVKSVKLIETREVAGA